MMEIVRIEGTTRTIGESQGYIGLPLRDILVNCTVGGEGTPAMQSAWLPSADEVAVLLRGGVIVLTVLGTSHPPAACGGGARRRRLMGAVPENVRERMYFPIIMPLDADGMGPASEESGEIRKITWEVWDQYCDTFGSFSCLADAIQEAERLNREHYSA